MTKPSVPDVWSDLGGSTSNGVPDVWTSVQTATPKPTTTITPVQSYPKPSATPTATPNLLNQVGDFLKPVTQKVSSFFDFLDHAGNPNNRTFSEAFTHDLQGYRFFGKAISPGEATEVNGKMVETPNKTVAELNKGNDFYTFNRQASGAVLSIIQGASGGIVKNTIKPEGVGEKIVNGVAQTMGSIVTLRAIGGVFGKLATGNATVARTMAKYPTAAKYVFPILKNIVGFDIYSQLDPEQKNRLQSLAVDTATGVLFSGMGFIGKAKFSIPANFGVGFGLAKLQGASNEDAFIAGGILAGLDTAGRVTQAAFATKFKDGVAEMSPNEARQAVVNSNLKDNPRYQGLADDVLRKSVVADETGGTIKITLKSVEPGIGTEVVGKVTKNPDLTTKAYGWNVEVIPGNGKPATLPGAEGAPVNKETPTAPIPEHPIQADLANMQQKPAAPEGNPTQPIAAVKPISPETAASGEKPATSPQVEPKAVVTRTKTNPDLEEAIQNYVSDSGVSNAPDGTPQETAALRDLTKVANTPEAIKVTQEQVNKAVENKIFDMAANGDIIVYRAGNLYNDNRLVSATYDKSVADAINLGNGRDGKDRPINEYQIKPSDIKAFIGGSEAEVLIQKPTTIANDGTLEGGWKEYNSILDAVQPYGKTDYGYDVSKSKVIVDNVASGNKRVGSLEELWLKDDFIKAAKNAGLIVDGTRIAKTQEDLDLWKNAPAGSTQELNLLRFKKQPDVNKTPKEVTKSKEDVNKPEPQDQIDKRDLEGDVMEAISSGDIEGARALHETLSGESGVKMASFEDLVQRIEDERRQTIADVQSELMDMQQNGNQDDPTNKLLEIANKLAAHFKAPGAKWKVTGKQRTYSTPDGEVLAVGGDATEAFDRLIYANDIDGFAKAIKVLHYKYDKVFTELNDQIQHGGIDGGDYDRFKEQFAKALESRTSNGTRRRQPSKSGNGQNKPETKPSGNETVKPVEVIKNTNKLFDKISKPDSNNPYKDSVIQQPIYHGTPYGRFDKFDLSKRGTGADGISEEPGIGDWGNGIYFAADKETAQSYADNLAKEKKTTTPYVIEAYVDVKNPLDLGKEMAYTQELWKILKPQNKGIFDATPADLEKALSIAGTTEKELGIIRDIAGTAEDNWGDFDIAGDVKAAGYDALIAPNDEIVIFDPDKITIKKDVNAEESFIQSETVEGHTNFINQLNKGNATIEEFQNRLQAVLDNKEAIVDELSGMTKDELLKKMGRMEAYQMKNEKKDRIVRSVYNDMIGHFALGKQIVWNMSSSYEDVVIQEARKMTQADIDAYVTERNKRIEEYKRDQEALVKSIKDPQTLDEFNTYLQYKGKDTLSKEQLERWDALKAEDVRARKAKELERNSNVAAVEVGNTEFTIQESVHTKKGTPIWVVKMSDRVARDTYVELNMKAKQLGGYYSRFSRGFIFDTKESAASFVSLKEGDVSNIEKVLDRKEASQQSAADRLMETADNGIEASNVAINQDRLSNTPRRARMAASAEESARHDLALYETMKRVATALKNGEVKYLAGLKHKTQLELLEKLLRAGKWAQVDTNHKDLQWEKKQELIAQPYTNEDVGYVKYPKYSYFKRNIVSMANDLKDLKGGVMDARRLLKVAQKYQDDQLITFNDGRGAEVIEHANQVLKEHGRQSWMVDEDIEELKRLKRMDITTPEELREALRELIKLRTHAKGESEISKLERELVGSNIDGFFPTPPEVVSQMLDAADIQPGQTILEPSAGKGDIIDAIMQEYPNAKVDAVEFNQNLQDLLKVKKYNIVGSDFMNFTGKYDRILMNPPFEKLQDIDHVMRAYEMLNPGGRIVSIMSEAPFFRSDKKAREFRDWLDAVGYSEPLPEGSFKNSFRSTGVNTRIVTIDKPNAVPSTDGSYSVAGGEGDVGGYATFTNSAPKFELKPVEMPELVRMAKEMLGSVPAMRKYKKWAGMFWHTTDKGGINLNPAQFENPVFIANTLAHEMGHAEGWMDDKTLKRGNLGGHIAALKSFLKSVIPEYPGAPGELTPKDRARLQREAKKLLSKEIEVTEEVVIDTKKVDPADILAIWNDATAGVRDPGLLKYIQNLSDPQKKQIAVAAMRGQVPEWVTFLREVKGTITHMVMKNSPEDIRALYQKMVKEEIEKRRLFDVKAIRSELKHFTLMWKPFAPVIGSPETKYRFSSKELYADAVSGLLRDPWLLKKVAPTFYQAFMNYLDARPNAAKIFNETWNLLNAGEEAVYQKRNEDIDKMFSNAETAFVAKEIEKKQKQVSLLHTIRLLVDDKYVGSIEKTNTAVKQGFPLADDANPIPKLHGLAYLDGKVQNYVKKNFEPIFKQAQKVANGWEELGKVLFYERVINERGELANPGGYDPKTAKDNLAKLETSHTPEEWANLQTAKEMFRAAVQKSNELAKENELYRPEMIEQMQMNPAYATYQVVDYIDTYISAQIHQQVGTLKDIANPATSTVMKLISVYKAVERNNAKKSWIEFNKAAFSDEVETADTRWNGKTLAAVEPKDPNKGLVIVIEGGKPKGYYIDKEIADSLKYVDNRTIQAASKVAAILSQSQIYRPLFTSLNLGFQSVNFVRDFMRYWKNTPDSNLGEALTSFPRAMIRYAQAAPHAFKRGFDLPDEMISAMKDQEILGMTYNESFKVEADDYRKQIEREMEKAGVPVAEKKKTLLDPIRRIFDVIEGLGDFVETLPKVAGYIELNNKMAANEKAEFIRTSLGSPDFRIGGTATPVTNKIFLFSNAIKEGMKTDLKIGFTKNRSRAGFWWKTIIADILPKLIMAGIAAGLLGKKLKKIMDSATEYDKTSYTIVPLGVDENGKGIYGRIAHDETGRFIGGLFWKILNMAAKKQATIADLFQIFDFSAGQLPNVAPSFTAFGTTIQYLSGLNPYDDFRGRYIIPDTEFKAGYKVSFPIYMKWLIRQQGLGIILPTEYYGANTPTGLEKFLNLPGIGNTVGRWIRVTDYGITEQENKINQKITEEKANKTLNTKNLLEKAVKDAKAAGDAYQKAAIKTKYLQDSMGKEKPTTKDDLTVRKAAEKKFEIGMLEGTVSREMDALINATNNDMKKELLTKYRKDMTPDDYKAMVVKAIRYKVFSQDFMKEVRMAKLY